MKPGMHKAIVPIWAQRIEVERRKDALFITGWGHTPDPLRADQVPPKLRSKLDILQGLRGYRLRHLGRPDEIASIYEFADATDDEKLIAFVTEFGPVSGRLLGIDASSAWEVKVREDLGSLRREQGIFRTMVQIVQQVNRNGLADLDVLRDLLNTTDVETFDQEILALSAIAGISPKSVKAADLVPMAHLTLCLKFNQHAPRLFAFNGEAVELPHVDFTGIRDALYFQLRLDYLAHRAIGTCLNCGGHFSVFKRGTRGCKPSCQRALRNQRYWTKSKSGINAQRRKKSTERK